MVLINASDVKTSMLTLNYFLINELISLSDDFFFLSHASNMAPGMAVSVGR